MPQPLPLAPPSACAPGRRVLGQVLAAVAFIVLVLVLDRLSGAHPMRGTQITAWNPQGALAVALLMRQPSAWWLAIIALTAPAWVRGLPSPTLADVGVAAALASGYVAAALTLRSRLGPTPALNTRAGCLQFLTLACATAGLTGSLYATAHALAGSLEPARLGAGFLRAWIGDVVSLVVTLPLCFTLLDPVRRARAAALLRSTEGWLLVVGAGLAATLVFARPLEEQFKAFYLLFLPVAWGAVRFGQVGAVGAAALVQVLLMIAVQSDTYVPLTVFELHLLLAVLGATGLLLGAIVDEREQAERTLRESLHAAAAADMAAALAHELNQPLTALRSYARAAQLMAQRGDEGQQADALRDVTGKLVAEVTRAGAVVRRLRDFFRQGGTELQPVEVGPLLDASVQGQAVRAHVSGVRLVLRPVPPVPPLWMDRVQIEVVLRNLIANAIEAAAQLPHGRVEVSATLRDAMVVVAVTDNGPGIAPDQLPAVFDARRSSKPGGMGLGLTISRSIVEAHGGRLWAEPGPGGRLFFSLPLEVAEHA